MVLSEEDKFFDKRLVICEGYNAIQLISATRVGLSTPCARCRWVEATSYRQLVKYPARTSSRQSLIKQLIKGELGWGHAFQR